MTLFSYIYKSNEKKCKVLDKFFNGQMDNITKAKITLIN